MLLSISRPLSRLFLPAHAALVNRTIDDSDTNTITYIPSDHWLPSDRDSESCPGCLKPNAQLALQQTFHYGMYPVPPPDSNDSPPNSSAKSRRTGGENPNFVDVNVTASMSFTGPSPSTFFNAHCLKRTCRIFCLNRLGVLRLRPVACTNSQRHDFVPDQSHLSCRRSLCGLLRPQPSNR